MLSSLTTQPRATQFTQFRCLLLGCAAVLAAPAELEDARRKLSRGTDAASRNSFLKHADPQTLAGLLAVDQALTRYGLDAASMGDWGVIGSPRAPGRQVIGPALAKFAREGAWSVSPHLVPHYSLHSLSGTISQALKMHGPNLGVGGLIGDEAQALLAAAAFLTDNRVPGLWVVWTGWHPEPTDQAQSNGEAPLCRAVALALAPGGARDGEPTLRLLTPTRSTTGSPGNGFAAASPFSLETLHASLSKPAAGNACFALPAHRWLELESVALHEEVRDE